MDIIAITETSQKNNENFKSNIDISGYEPFILAKEVLQYMLIRSLILLEEKIKKHKLKITNQCGLRSKINLVKT